MIDIQSKKIAVVLLNLGGPLVADDVRPFLKNLFNDRAIINLPAPIRGILAAFIAKRRERAARAVYAHLGGGSPLLDNTRAQARALETELGPGFRVFIAMRYWHPFASETVVDVKDFGPERVILLPLYPQYSTTTTASSLKSWYDAAADLGYAPPTTDICCYGSSDDVLASYRHLIVDAVLKLPAPYGKKGAYRVLFSAHGLPRRIVDRKKDPYPGQVQSMVRDIVGRLDLEDSVLCYQSRVGPLEWIGPSTENEIRRAALDKKAIIVVPIAFVSEHSETLVELDIEYRDLAIEAGAPIYIRVPAPGVDPLFIRGLGGVVRNAVTNGVRMCPYQIDFNKECLKDNRGCSGNVCNVNSI